MSLFTKIINGEIPCYKIAESETCIAFLDINPNAPGHTLCVPKREVDKIFDLSNEEYLALMLFAKQVAHALEQAIVCKRIGMAVIGLEVPHVHVHLIPLRDMHDIRFVNKVTLSPEDFEAIATEIKRFL
jgi:histidine triad (HIT) family protein